MKTIFTFLCLCLCTIALFAQDNQFKEPIPRTPNAASLGKYVDIPVSYHTGVPNISIPIYTVQEGELSLPISLSYHSSGIKVNEVASWVGLGWSLNAGGVISRTVIGGRDEGITNSMISGGYSDEEGWGWYKDYGLLDKIENPYLCSTGGNPNDLYPPGPTNCRSYFLDAANGLIDTEPDIFTFNFQGYSGKFFFDENRTPHTIPMEDIYIEPINDEANNDFFISWKLTAPDGTKYYFGETDATEKNYTNNAEGVGNISQQYNTATSWYLYRIESVNGTKWIKLEYESENYSVGDRLSHNVVIGNGENCSPSSSLILANQYLILNNVQGMRLSKITTSSENVTVDFIESTNVRQDLTAFQSRTNINTEAKYLSKIIISTNDGNQKKFMFDIDYFQSDLNSGYPNGVSPYSEGHDAKRLRFNSIQEVSGNGLVTKRSEERRVGKECRSRWSPYH